jgi:hypothetical protein
VFPTLEDIPNRVCTALPGEVLVIKHTEESETVLGFLASTDCKSAWWDRERTKMRTIEVAVESTRKRSVRGDYPVVRFDFVVELEWRFGAGKWHARRRSAMSVKSLSASLFALR